VSVAACSRTNSVFAGAGEDALDASFKRRHVSDNRGTPLLRLARIHTTHTRRLHARTVTHWSHIRRHGVRKLRTTSHFPKQHHINYTLFIFFSCFDTPYVQYNDTLRPLDVFTSENLASLECTVHLVSVNHSYIAREEGSGLRRGAVGPQEQGEEDHVAPACPIRPVPLHPRHTPGSSAANTRRKAHTRMFDHLQSEDGRAEHARVARSCA